MMKIYSVFDSKAQAFTPPFYAPNVAIASRTVVDILRDPQHIFYRYSDDFVLFELGDFDENTGSIDPSSLPVNLGVLTSFIPSVPQIG